MMCESQTKFKKIDQIFTLLFFSPVSHITRVQARPIFFVFNNVYNQLCVCVLWPLKMKINLFHIHPFLLLLNVNTNHLYTNKSFSLNKMKIFSTIFFQVWLLSTFFSLENFNKIYLPFDYPHLLNCSNSG